MISVYLLLDFPLLPQCIQCLAICETRTREGGEVSAFTPLLSCKFVFANAAAVSTTIVTKSQTYQPNIKVMFNQVNQH